MTDAPGLYLHVPFCAAKCPYCDFYSLPVDDAAMDAYCASVLDCLDAMSVAWPRNADSLYFGGGTPSLLGAKRLAALIGRARERFGLFDAEITVELNPSGGGTYKSGALRREEIPAGLERFLHEVRVAGANRLSMGLQSAVPAELAALGRRHTPEDAAHTVAHARAAGFENISVDLMLGVPGQTVNTAEVSARFCAELGVEHLSAYLLKVEPGTPFERQNILARCPDDDAQAELYLTAVRLLEAHGYRQYEISNFAKPGYESRHNLKYWDCREYLGIGPAAHSLTNGVRWYWPRNLEGFVRDWRDILLEDGDVPARLASSPGAVPTEESVFSTVGVSFVEYAMLRLRLACGLRRDEALARYPDCAPAFDEMLNRAAPLRKAGLLYPDEDSLALTPNGFLLSNAVTLRLLPEQN